MFAVFSHGFAFGLGGLFALAVMAMAQRRENGRRRGMLCDSCKHAKPIKNPYYQTEDGREWKLKERYVRCAVRRPMWTVEKRNHCNDYKER